MGQGGTFGDDEQGALRPHHALEQRHDGLQAADLLLHQQDQRLEGGRRGRRGREREGAGESGFRLGLAIPAPAQASASTAASRPHLLKLDRLRLVVRDEVGRDEASVEFHSLHHV